MSVSCGKSVEFRQRLAVKRQQVSIPHLERKRLDLVKQQTNFLCSTVQTRVLQFHCTAADLHTETREEKTTCENMSFPFKPSSTSVRIVSSLPFVTCAFSTRPEIEGSCTTGIEATRGWLVLSWRTHLFVAEVFMYSLNVETSHFTSNPGTPVGVSQCSAKIVGFLSNADMKRSRLANSSGPQ